MARPIVELEGVRFGSLTVISRAENDKSGNVQFHCRCDCGNEENVIRAGNLKTGRSTSCGMCSRAGGVSSTRSIPSTDSVSSTRSGRRKPKYDLLDPTMF
jgi:hypothetical protein